jgi:hypothetical protein
MLAQKIDVGADCTPEFFEAILAIRDSFPRPGRSKQLNVRLVQPSLLFRLDPEDRHGKTVRG